ncbi:MAG: hypothetical protein JXA94_00565 [Parachlamydiales bacterium]|nr:hypothetical protein [Parachlamydiales bacterium]
MAVAIKEQHVEREQEMMPISSVHSIHAFGKDVHPCLLLLMLQMHKKGLDDKDILRLMKNIEENYGSSDDDSNNNITLDMKENIFLLLGSMMHNAKEVNNMNKMAVLADEKESQKEYQNSVDKWSKDNQTAAAKAKEMYKTSAAFGSSGTGYLIGAIAAAVFIVVGIGLCFTGALAPLGVGLIILGAVMVLGMYANHSINISNGDIFSSEWWNSNADQIVDPKGNKTLDQGKYSDWQDYTNGTINQDQSEAQKRLQETQTIMQSEFDPLQQNDQEFYNLLNTCYNWFGQIGQSKS